jgi:hypothetical protein
MMMDRRNRGAAFGVLCAALVAARADAQPNPASTKAHQAHPAAAEAAKGERKDPKADKAQAKADKAADKAEAKADKAEAKADRAEAKAEAKADRAEAKAEAKADRAEADKGAAQTDEASEAGAGAHADRARGLGRGRGQHVSAMRSLREELRHGKLDKSEVDERLAALKENTNERCKAHREDLGKRWGSALGNAATREELRHHARRMAFLNRALLLAESEKAGKDKDKLVERIEKLIEKENARHERAMERFEPKPQAATTQPAAAQLPSKEGAR